MSKLQLFRLQIVGLSYLLVMPPVTISKFILNKDVPWQISERWSFRRVKLNLECAKIVIAATRGHVVLFFLLLLILGQSCTPHIILVEQWCANCQDHVNCVCLKKLWKLILRYSSLNLQIVYFYFTKNDNHPYKSSNTDKIKVISFSMYLIKNLRKSNLSFLLCLWNFEYN